MDSSHGAAPASVSDSAAAATAGGSGPDAPNPSQSDRRGGADRTSSSSSPSSSSALVWAAGGILLHARTGCIAIVHRSVHGDWTLPKGKPDPSKGETGPEDLAATALREVREETGFGSGGGGGGGSGDGRGNKTAAVVRLGPFAGTTSHRLPDGAAKIVLYWHMTLVESGRWRRSGSAARPSAAAGADGSSLVQSLPNPDEIDAVRWVTPGRALDLLTHPSERALVEEHCLRHRRAGPWATTATAAAGDAAAMKGDAILGVPAWLPRPLSFLAYRTARQRRLAAHLLSFRCEIEHAARNEARAAEFNDNDDIGRDHERAPVAHGGVGSPASSSGSTAALAPGANGSASTTTAAAHGQGHGHKEAAPQSTSAGASPSASSAAADSKGQDPQTRNDNGPGAWVDSARELLAKAQAAYARRAYEESWQCLLSAHRVRIEGFGREEALAAAVQLRTECGGKLGGWRGKAVVALLDPQEIKSASLVGLRRRLADATLLRDSRSTTQYHAIALLREQLALLSGILVLLVLGVLVMAEQRGLPPVLGTAALVEANATAAGREPAAARESDAASSVNAGEESGGPGGEDANGTSAAPSTDHDAADSASDAKAARGEGGEGSEPRQPPGWDDQVRLPSLVLGYVVLFGMMGGCLSGAWSISKTANATRIPERLLDWTATVARPLLGAGAAVAAFTLLNAGVLPSEKHPWAVLAVAFLAGFSERYLLKAMPADDRGSDDGNTRRDRSSPE